MVSSGLTYIPGLASAEYSKIPAVRHLLCLSDAFVKSDQRSLSLAQTDLKLTGGRKVQHQGEHGRAIGQEALQLYFHSQGYLAGSKPNL